MIIRNAEKKDLKKCEEMSYCEELQWASGEFFHYDYFLDYLSTDDTFLIIEENQEVIGYILGEKLKAYGATIWAIGIQKDYQNKGIGTILLHEFEKKMKSQGVQWINLIAKKENNKLHNFYNKNGFFSGNSFVEFEKDL